jgi:hypothetical protein
VAGPIQCPLDTAHLTTVLRRHGGMPLAGEARPAAVGIAPRDTGAATGAAQNRRTHQPLTFGWDPRRNWGQ